MAYYLLADPQDECNGVVLRNITTTTQRRIAEIEFVEAECVIPDRVDLNEVFDIKIVYRVKSFVRNNYNNMLDNFPDPSFWDGGFYKTYYESVVPYIAWWTWRFTQLQLHRMKGIASPEWELAASHGRTGITPPQKFTWTFRGTITDLLGVAPTDEGYVTVKWMMTGSNYGFHDPSDFWPYDWEWKCNWQEACGGALELTKQVYVNLTPTPPYPLFDTDGCAVSKEFVTPDESFDILTRIVNANHYSGAYTIISLCLGNEIVLHQGTIGGNATADNKKTVTANQLVGEPITKDRYIYPEIIVYNSDGETDRWPTPGIAVVVTNGDEVSLSGKVTDKKTGLALSGVLVTVAAKSAYTNNIGIYSLTGLSAGTVTVKFTKTGYWDVSTEKKLLAGPNTLNVAMTPESEPPPPDGEVPWGLIAGAAGAIVLIAVVAKGAKK